MEIVISEEKTTDYAVLQLVKEVWKIHPLRRYGIDQLLKRVILEIEESKVCEGIFPDNHPKYILKCSPNSSNIPPIPFHNVIYHELTHLIDRFDSEFTNERSPEEVTKCINSLPRGNKNEGHIFRAFFDYWNTYIDGRLNKHGIDVYSLDDRIEQKLGTRKKLVSEIEYGERESMEYVWGQDVCTLNDLIEFATRYPNRRAKWLWINDPSTNG